MTSIFVGRKNELELLDALLKKALNRTLQLCFVVGEPGDGKTTLVEHFIDGAQESYPSLSFAVGTCQEISIEKSYEPFHDIFSQLTGVRARELQSIVGGRREFDLKQKIAIATQTLVDVTPELINILVPGVALLTKVVGTASNQIIKRRIDAGAEDSSISEDQLREKCIQFFTTLSKESPLILVLDDVQWIDPLSFRLLQYLQDKLDRLPILIIVAYRPYEISSDMRKWVNDIIQNYGDITIELHSHPEKEGCVFTKDFLQQYQCDVSDEFTCEFNQRTRGKPLYAVELLNYLISNDVLVRNNLGIYEENPQMKNWSEIPGRITKLNALIDSRFGSLNKECIEILQIASVEGYEFTAQVISTVTGKPEIYILEILSNVLGLERGFVKEVEEQIVGSTIISRFRFVNILYQERVYSSMPTGVRRIRHCQVAQALEHLHCEDLETVAVFLAKHYEKANNPSKASEYLVMLGKQQLDNRQTEEGLNILERALSLARTQDHVSSTIDAMRLIGMELVGKGGEDEKLQQIAEQYLEPAATLAREHQHLRELSYCLRGMGRLKRAQKRPIEAMYNYMEALSIANQVNDRSAAGAALNNIGVIASAEGRYKDAQSFFDQRLQIALEMGSRDATVMSYINLASVTRKLEQFKDAREYINKGFDSISQYEDWLRETGLKIELAYVEAAEGNLIKASKLLLETLSIATAKNHHNRLLDNLACAGDVLSRTEHTILAAQIVNFLKDKTSFSKAEVTRIEKLLLDREHNEEPVTAALTNMSLDDLLSKVKPVLKKLAS